MGIDGLLGQRGRGLEPDERQDGVDGPGDDPGEPLEAVDGGELRPEDGEIVVAAGFDDQPHGQGSEHADLEQADEGAGSSADLDAEIAEDEHDDRRGEGGDPPPLAVSPPELLMEHGGHQMAEDQVEEWRYQRLDERVPPGDEESDGRMDPARRVG